MTIVGRITKDAVVSRLKDERAVANFSIAVNEYYRAKNGETVKQTTYCHCSYWLRPKIAERLKKGSLVEVSGRIYVTAFTDVNGHAKASLNCHVNHIKVHQWSKEVELLGAAQNKNETIDDVPF